MANKWIILQSTLCQGTIPAWFEGDGDDNDRPVVHDTQEAAQAEMLEEYHIDLGRQIEEFKSGDRDFEAIDTELQDWVEPCTINRKGIITIEAGEIYNPKTYVR